jgi:hypothetical protein
MFVWTKNHFLGGVEKREGKFLSVTGKLEVSLKSGESFKEGNLNGI